MLSNPCSSLDIAGSESCVSACIAARSEVWLMSRHNARPLTPCLAIASPATGTLPIGTVWTGIPCPSTRAPTAHRQEGEAGAAAILAQIPRPTALLCLSDRLAEGALRAAHKLGLRVPADLSLVGFDDAVPTAAALDLTTVRQPSRRKGEKAAQALLAVLQGSTSLASPAPTANAADRPRLHEFRAAQLTADLYAERVEAT